MFGVHGIGGIVGAILTGVFASSALGGSVADLNIANHVFWQTVGVIVTLAYSGILTAILVKIVDATIGIRVTAEEESTGLDIALHNERGFNL